MKEGSSKTWLTTWNRWKMLSKIFITKACIQLSWLTVQVGYKSSGFGMGCQSNNIAVTLDQASKSVCQKWIPALFFVSQKGRLKMLNRHGLYLEVHYLFAYWILNIECMMIWQTHTQHFHKSIGLRTALQTCYLKLSALTAKHTSSLFPNRSGRPFLYLISFRLTALPTRPQDMVDKVVQ